MAGPVYFPILRTKAGEIDAIGRLARRTRQLTRPMLDFPVQKAKDARPLDQYLSSKVQEIACSWGTGDTIYLDFSRYEPDAYLSDGRHVVEYVFDISKQMQLKAVPVMAPPSLRGPGTHYFDAVSRIAARDKRGIALRLPQEDFATKKVLERALQEALSLTSAAPADIDIYLDAESFAFLPTAERDDLVVFVGTLRAAAQAVQSLGYRRVIFAASSVPGTMTRHEKSKVLRVTRTEFQVWRDLVRDPALSFLRFGDYGVVYPLQVESEVPVRPPSRIRVATEDEYLQYKGKPNEIRPLSKTAIGDGALRGQADSWGANAVRECAAGHGNGGNATTWVAHDTNMHIESTIAAIARYVKIDPMIASLAETATGIPWLQESLELFNDG